MDINQDYSHFCLNQVENRGTQGTQFSSNDTLGQQQTCSGPDFRRPRSYDTKCDYRHADASPSPSLITKASRNIYRHLATCPPRQTLRCPRRLCCASRSKSLRPLRLAIYVVLLWSGLFPRTPSLPEELPQLSSDALWISMFPSNAHVQMLGTAYWRFRASDWNCSGNRHTSQSRQVLRGLLYQRAHSSCEWVFATLGLWATCCTYPGTTPGRWTH